MENRNTFLPESESNSRVDRMRKSLAAAGLDGIFLFDPMDQFYYAGTMQNGCLFISAEKGLSYFVRRSLERANAESPVSEIHPYVSFRDISGILQLSGVALGKVGIEETTLPLSLFKLLQKNFPSTQFLDAGLLQKRIRAVKSEYEIVKMRRAGEVSRKVLEILPSLLKVGITEWKLALELHSLVSDLGRNCLSRLSPGTGEFFLGNVCFGDSSLKPTAFDGPGGMPGLSPACPFGGSHRTLKEGDLVYIDIGYPFEEYYVDKTRLFAYKSELSREILGAHAFCLEIESQIAQRLRPGSIPSKIYEDVMALLDEEKKLGEQFMGFKSNQVKFLGHGIGMAINEFPVIAKKFDEPLEQGMTLAIEPKNGLPGLGMVGVEDTFLVTAGEAENLTWGPSEIVVVG